MIDLVAFEDTGIGLLFAGELRARKQRKKEQTDSVDQLARQYLTKFFSDAPAGAGKAGKGKGGSSGNAGAAAGQRSALKRWFE